MNKIEKNIYEMNGLLRKSTLTEKEQDNQIEQLNSIKRNLIEDAYKNNNISFLVNTDRININKLDISEMKCYKDYYILTSLREYMGETFINEEEYKKYLRENECDIVNGILIVTYDENRNTLKEEIYKIYDKKEDAEKELNSIDLKEMQIPYIVYVPRLNEKYDEEATFDTIEGANEYLDDRIEEEYKNYFEDFENLDFECDEIMYNIVYGFDSNFGIDEEIAKKCGLGVLELNNGDKYLFLKGYGMDMSFTLVHYMALHFNKIDEDYLMKLEWTKNNVTKKEWIEILEKVGVDLDKLNIQR